MSQLTKEVLEEAYVRLKSQRRLARELGIPEGSVNALLREAGIEPQPNRNRPQQTSWSAGLGQRRRDGAE